MYFSFSLGSKATADRYIDHFTDIFTKEEAGKAVRITHRLPGQETRETCSTVLHDINSKNHLNLRFQNTGRTFIQVRKTYC